MSLPNYLIEKAIQSESGHLAWKREDIFIVIDELIKNDYAILGGDVWAIQTNKDSLHNKKLVYSQISVGIIKGIDNNEMVFNWYSNRLENEQWKDFIKRSGQNSKDYIIKANVENLVHEMYHQNIAYNLVYVDLKEFEKLRD